MLRSLTFIDKILMSRKAEEFIMKTNRAVVTQRISLNIIENIQHEKTQQTIRKLFFFVVLT